MASSMALLYARLVYSGAWKISKVPAKWKTETQAEVKKLKAAESE